ICCRKHILLLLGENLWLIDSLLPRALYDNKKWLENQGKSKLRKPEAGPKRVRRNKYIPHLAAARFKPSQDWSFEEARRLYDASNSVDVVHYVGNIDGMRRLSEDSGGNLFKHKPSFEHC
ncbi:MAG: hypothetical protein ACRECH_15220, partial [Nitrososphaerales archaeon]